MNLKETANDIIYSTNILDLKEKYQNRETSKEEVISSETKSWRNIKRNMVL